MHRSGPSVRISVIVPAYNGAPNLSKCSAALEATQIPTCEIPVVDGESSEAPLEIARRSNGRAASVPLDLLHLVSGGTGYGLAWIDLHAKRVVDIGPARRKKASAGISS